MKLLLAIYAFSLPLCARATPTPQQVRAATEPPQATVTISYATVIGNVKNNVESFGGIPYAEPPTGSLRLKPPKKIERQLGVLDATGPAGACPQMFFDASSSDLSGVIGRLANTPFVQNISGQSEDCLTMTVARPEGVKADDKLPVLFWIFGGAFEVGWSSMYDGTNLLNSGIDSNQPFIFVAVNYRCGGFGFLGGKEIMQDGSANLGLLDQRMGLEWVADHIADFGGDPEKVTLWGESAGAISIVDHLVMYGGNITYKGKPLFRGAIMDSGAALPAAPIDGTKAQGIYDKVVETAGCSTAPDTLDCLRTVNYSTFLTAVNSVPFCLSYDGVALSYLPRPDGVVLPDSPDVLIRQGKYTAVPMINGNQEDEGTLFSLFQSNLTTTEALVEYFSETMFPGSTTAQIKSIIDTYPTDASSGSPYRTGAFNEVYTGFKRLASVMGDVLFILSRRSFLETANTLNPDVPSWSYMASYDYLTPVLGTFHGSDLIQVFYGIWPNYAAKSIHSYYLSFLYTLDPNEAKGDYPDWPRWSTDKQSMQFNSLNNVVISDDFRQSSYEQIGANADVLKL